ncbi:MAG: hypothetical protein IJ852_01840, partial [Alphaproteobacteria bacterium]|nr:hypothetical protein [Alphaproteobacteria bacterium]
ETISGYKILTGGVTLKSIANMQEGGTYINGNPSVVQRFGTIQFLDSANGLKGYVHNYQATNGDVVSTLVTTNGTSSGGISIGSKLNGSVYTQAPASDATNSVVTTTGISKSENGFVKLGNGIIIQWGRYPSYVNPDPQSVTFPTPFTSANYKAVCTYFRTGGDVDSGKDHINVDTQSTTGFTFRMSDTTEYGVNWIAIGY